MNRMRGKSTTGCPRSRPSTRRAAGPTVHRSGVRRSRRRKLRAFGHRVDERLLGARRLRRRNRDLRAIERALQRRDSGGVVALPALFNRRIDLERPGIAIGVVARVKAGKLLAAGHRVLARCLRKLFGRRWTGIADCNDCTGENYCCVEEVLRRHLPAPRGWTVKKELGCVRSLDDQIDLNIPFENNVMLRGVDQSSPR